MYRNIYWSYEKYQNISNTEKPYFRVFFFFFFFFVFVVVFFVVFFCFFFFLGGGGLCFQCNLDVFNAGLLCFFKLVLLFSSTIVTCSAVHFAFRLNR